MRPEYTTAFIARFWSHVKKTETCWLWMGAKTVYGYGSVLLTKKPKTRHMLAHRVSYELQNGPTPQGQCVCHHCDVKLCVRLDHCFTGTNADNAADRHRKGRTVFGEEHGMAKLTVEMVREIRDLRHAGVTSRELGVRYRIHPAYVNQVVRRDRWLHVL